MPDKQSTENSTINDLVALMKIQSTKLDSIQKDIQTSKDEVKEYVDEKLGGFGKKFEEMEMKINHQDEIIGSLGKKLLESEMAVKRRNLILYRIAESEKTQTELMQGVLNLLEKIIPNINHKDIDFIYRLGKKENNNRPIIVGFTTAIMKEDILRNKSKLKTENIGISEDLPQAIREKRKEAAPIIKALYDKGYKVYMKRDKIVVNGEHKRRPLKPSIIHQIKDQRQHSLPQK